LEYGKVPSSQHAWVRNVFEVVGMDAEHVYVSLGKGFGTIAYARKPHPSPPNP
jgi:hypothetical protein